MELSMRTYNKLFLFLLLTAMLGLTACKKDETNPVTPVAINESETAINYLEAQGDFIGTSFVIAAADYKTAYLADPAKIYTIDLRSAADYTTKHLKGAVNVTMANLLTHLEAVNFDNYNKIVVTCYSGQTAAYAVGLVRTALPFAKASKLVSLKWGMSSIDSSFAQSYWLSKRANTRASVMQTSAAPAKPAKVTLPVLSTGKTTAAEIIKARVNALLTEGFTPATINEATLYTNLSNYFIVNYWPNNIYLLPGHIEGAYNYEPSLKPFLSANDLKTLPIDKDVVIYCYTGQSSAYTAAILRVYGYRAKTLLYGANGIMWELMKTNNVASTFLDSEIKGYTDLLQ